MRCSTPECVNTAPPGYECVRCGDPLCEVCFLLGVLCLDCKRRDADATVRADRRGRDAELAELYTDLGGSD